MKKILIVNAYYYPGYRSGGPQQSMMNLVDVFGEQCEFYILTHNHDFGVTAPYENVKHNCWVTVGKAKVFYSSRDKYSMGFLRKFVEPFDIIYLCEPYQEHSYKLLFLNKQRKIHGKIILAPMGCFSDGALSQKALKKAVFWKVFQFLKLYRNIEWSFTSELEKKEAVNVLYEKCIQKYMIAEDLPRKYIDFSQSKDTGKQRGTLKIVFLSRICPQKNLLYAIQVISKLKGKIIFDIYGTIEDRNYWEKCEKLLRNLPKNVIWNYRNSVEAEKILNVFKKYDVFLFPTLGENFGHVIYEALVAGCVTVISDQTPWMDLQENGCGHSIALKDENRYVKCLQSYVDLSTEEMKSCQLCAMQLAERKYQSSVSTSGYRKLFD